MKEYRLIIAILPKTTGTSKSPKDKDANESPEMQKWDSASIHANTNLAILARLPFRTLYKVIIFKIAINMKFYSQIHPILD